jgi:hypothetical protein
MLNMGSLKNRSWVPFFLTRTGTISLLKTSAFADVIMFADDTSILNSDKNMVLKNNLTVR